MDNMAEANAMQVAIRSKRVLIPIPQKLESFIIGLDSPCSSPTESSESDYYSDDSLDLSRLELDAEEVEVAEAPISSVLKPLGSATGIEKRQAENKVLDFLHGSPVCLADVEMLIPEFMRNAKIMNKLATNIGLHHSRGSISALELEKMLEYIFARGDATSMWALRPHHIIFEKVKGNVERFKQQATENARHGNTRKWLARHDANEKEKAARLAAKDAKQKQARERQLRREMESYGERVQHWDTAIERQFLPYRTESITDLITTEYGLSFKEAMGLQAINDQHAVNSEKRAEDGELKKWQLKRATPGMFQTQERKDWAQSRPHEYSGVLNLNSCVVYLPAAKADLREVITSPQDVHEPKQEALPEDSMWAQTAAVFSSPSMDTKGGRIKVLLPPTPDNGIPN